MSPTATMPAPPAPCGYCRRCAIHDDPGGCLTVEAWERENPQAALIAQGRYAAAQYEDAVERQASYDPMDFEWFDGETEIQEAHEARLQANVDRTLAKLQDLRAEYRALFGRQS